MKRLLAISFFVLSATVHAQEIKKVKITDLEKIVRDSKNPLIVNFWATWCMPCIEEIPYFQTLVKKYEKDSVKLLLVSLDMKEDYEKLRPFATKRKFTAPIVWLNESNADYFCPKVDEKWSGAIPATLFINHKTGYRKFFEEQIKEEALEKEIMAILGKN
ncbi:MAG: TlpA family protein disulfide reductase [Chitinophagaceae bacterium]|nr:TlpA family protein disulfide reductase [Chitinophagaceae bacterium]